MRGASRGEVEFAFSGWAPEDGVAGGFHRRDENLVGGYCTSRGGQFESDDFVARQGREKRVGDAEGLAGYSEDRDFKGGELDVGQGIGRTCGQSEDRDLCHAKLCGSPGGRASYIPVAIRY